MALPMQTKPMQMSPAPMADIGTAPPWLRAKPKPANDFDSGLANLHGMMGGFGPSPTEPGMGSAIAPADDMQRMDEAARMPGAGGSIAPPAGMLSSLRGAMGSIPTAPNTEQQQLNESQRMPGSGGAAPSSAMGGLSSMRASFGALKPATDPAEGIDSAAGPTDDLHQTLSKNYDALIGKNGHAMMESAASGPAVQAPAPVPKMAAASSGPQMEASSTAAGPAPAPAPAPAEDPFLAAIRGNTGPGQKPPWMVQRDAELLKEATGVDPNAAAGPATAAGPAAPAAGPAAAAAPTASMSSVFGSTPGVAVGAQAPWEGANPIAMTRANDSALPDVNQDFAGQAQKGADAAYKGATQFFDEDFKRDRSDMESKLINQGFAPGSEGFDRELGLMMRSQNAARENAGFMAQGVGHAQAGDLLQRALASRATLMGERERDADRTHAQTVDVANLGLGARAQDKGVEQASLNSAGASASAGASLAASRYNTDASTNLALRQLGLSEDAQGFNQMMALINSSRGGVNAPNFGPPAPLDVGGANAIASGNANAAANRGAVDRASLANLGGAALGAVDWNSLFGTR